MRRRGTFVRAAGLGALLAVAGLGWFELAPRALGGRTTYVTIAGRSMTPRLRAGDLVLVRPRESYTLGDVAAYRSTSVRAVVLHRIVRLDGDRFVFKGDANDFEDPEPVSRDRIVGELWHHLAGGGVWLARMHSPWFMLSAAMATAAVALGGWTSLRRRRRRRSPGPLDSPGGVQDPAPDPSLGAAMRPARTAAVGVTVALAVVEAVLLVRPAAARTAVDLPFRQEATFAYSADGGTAYDGGTVPTGRPVFLRIARSVAVSLTYRFEARAEHHVEGTLRTAIVLADDVGWERTLSSTPPVAFTGDLARGALTIDLRTVDAALQAVQAATGVHRDWYRIRIETEVSLRGAMGGAALSESYRPALAFRLDQTQLTLEGEGTASGPVVSSLDGVRRVEVGVPARIHLAALSATVVQVRRAAAAATGVGALVVMGLWIAAARARRRPSSTPARVPRRYAPWIVPVAGLPRSLRDGHRVASIGALMRLADRFDRVVLHQRGLAGEVWIVEDGDTLYWFGAGDPAPSESPSVP